MEQQKHIVNRQILEVKLPTKADSFAVQNQLSAISREELTSIIDRVLSKQFGNDDVGNLQLDRLVIDLGAVKLDDFAAVFEERFEAIVSEVKESDSFEMQDGKNESENRGSGGDIRSGNDLGGSRRGRSERAGERGKQNEREKQSENGKQSESCKQSESWKQGEREKQSEREGMERRGTPLRLLAHYLSEGILPWWAAESSKSYLNDQLEDLLKSPESNFVKMLAQLRYNEQHLERFIHTFSEKQVLRSLQLLVTFQLTSLIDAQQDFYKLVRQKNNTAVSATKAVAASTSKTRSTPTSKTLRAFEGASVISDQTVKMIFWKAIFQQVPNAVDVASLKNACIAQVRAELAINEDGKALENKQLEVIRSLVKGYSTKYRADSIWQEFFKQVVNRVNRRAFNRVHPKLLQELKHLLLALEHMQKNSRKEIATDAMLRPLAEHLQMIQATVHPVKQDKEPRVIEQLISDYEATDFITIQNAGLVLFWPFLTRFFQNLGLIEDNDFRDEYARNKAICALQYLCSEDDSELFEGSLSLNKLFCGALLEDVVAPISLTEAEMKIVGDLLQVVIQRGPHWQNLSVKGLRSFYLNRQGSLRMRDGHWLLQVEKQTYDITMEKLPWTISTVKLPWMDKIILVEWM